LLRCAISNALLTKVGVLAPLRGVSK